MSLNIQDLLLISKNFKQLKIGFWAFMVNSHKFWPLLYLSHYEMTTVRIALNMTVFAFSTRL